MSAVTEQFNLISDAVKARNAPAEIVSAFNEFTTLREELKKLDEPEDYSINRHIRAIKRN